jgi:hypothetical protein
MAAIGLVRLALDGHCIHWRLKSYEENTWDGAGAQPAVREFGRTIRVRSRFQGRRCLTLVRDPQFARHEHHTLSGRVPMQRQFRICGHLEEDIDIRLRRVPVQYGYCAAFGQERRAGTPPQPAIVSGPRDRRLLVWRLRVDDRDNGGGSDQYQRPDRYSQCAAFQALCRHSEPLQAASTSISQCASAHSIHSTTRWWLHARLRTWL